MIAALSAGGALAAGVSAALEGPGTAAQLPSACTADPLRVSYSIQYSATLSADAVTGITVTDAAAAPDLTRCAGAGYAVTLRDAEGGSLATARGTVPADAAEFSSSLPVPVPAARVAQATLTLAG